MSSLMFSFLKIILSGIYRVNNYTLNESSISVKHGVAKDVKTSTRQ